MAKRSAKRTSQRPYDDDEFNENDIMEEDLDEEEDAFDEDYEDSYSDDDDYEEEEPRKPRKVARKKTSRKHASETETSKGGGRRKAYWSVYSQNFQKVETFEYGDKEAAEKKAAELTESKKILHFVKLDKKDII
ncbi:MAG: hypothetical protein Q4C70_06755 [Planctomycetia bacterium]|nr:hypothetical protein [Planctomycetia bacterium]